MTLSRFDPAGKVDELLPAVLELVLTSLDASTATILLLDEDLGELTVRASLGFGADAELRVPVGSGIAGLISEQGRSGVFDDVLDAAGPQLAATGIRSLVGAPIQIAGRAVGVIHAGTTASPGFTTGDARLLQVFADMVALAIINAHPHDAEREARAETEVAQSRLSEIMGDLDAIVWEAETPEREQLTFVGGRAGDILGFPVGRWTAEKDFWRGLIHPDDRERTMLFFSEAARERSAHELEYRLRAADGRVVWVNDKVRVVGDDPSRPRVRGVMVDVTERRELAGRLLHSQKMEAVGQLAGGIAHDFNNLLTVILGFANILAARLDEGAGSELKEIRQAAERAAALTHQLLAFSRRQPHTSELVDVNALVSSVEQMVRHLIGEDVRLTITASAELALVRADPSQLEQVLVNLVVNARDALSIGGEIRIAVSTVDADERSDESEPPGEHVVLSVSDTGTGMSEETAARIFEPFFTTKEQGKGTGLGLATVYGIVEQAGGRIAVASEVGRGTEFTISLPAATEAAAGEETVATILLAEDEPALRKLARLILEEEHYHVIEARNGRDALEHATRHRGTIDLLLTDIVMPELSGPDLVAELVSVRPDISVIYMSGYTDSRIAGRNLADESRSLLRKPFDADELTRQVRAALVKPA
ncbi:MAG: ATP-binding protein [Actinomycetota bacterium]|nr:ATP-binding protein [Actinomycetota bacterium]